MTDDFTAPEKPAQSAVAQVADTIQSASRNASEAIEAGRQPGMPLDILSKLVREAPLHSLAIAFLVGMVISRRR